MAEKIEKREKFKTSRCGELSRSSQDSFGSESDSDESRDEWLNYSQMRHFGLFALSQFDRFDIPCDSIDIVSEGRAELFIQTARKTSNGQKIARIAPVWTKI